jgi:hypothetical protein
MIANNEKWYLRRKFAERRGYYAVTKMFVCRKGRFDWKLIIPK